MKFKSIKHQAEIEFDEKTVELCKYENRLFCIGKDLIGNQYKVYLNENNLIEDAIQIHFVKDC